MRLLFGLILMIGLGLAGFAVYMAQGYISQYQAALEQERSKAEQQVKLIEIFVADHPLKYGEQVRAKDVRKVKWPEEAVPNGAFTSIEDLLPKNKPDFRTVLRSMEKNEPVLAVKVTDPGADAGITSRLSKGMRAFTVNVDVSSGVSGFLRPGDKVDVYWTGSVGNRNKFTKLIQPNMRLIAVDQSVDEERAKPDIARTVTIEATPTQVAALAQAQSTGKLMLSLVGAQDQTISSGVEVDQNQLLGIEKKQEVVQAAPQEKCTIRTRKGSEVIETPIPCTN
ncbi:MAG: Flp pilus assembly protein CpaB [Paracoccaceae bacterium]